MEGNKQALHFGAGNIGRGFIGLLLNRSGYRVTFADINTELVHALNQADHYTVWEISPPGSPAPAKPLRVDNFSAINLAQNPAEAIEAISQLAIVTTAVGPAVLPKIAPLIAAGLRERTASAPLLVMACENSINATDILRREILQHFPQAEAIFANTAVDRVVPDQQFFDYLAPIDVAVESYFEWTIEKRAADLPDLAGVTWVDDLNPYIERKLFTVNTGHAALAYFGHLKGYQQTNQAIQDPEIFRKVEAVLSETKQFLVTKYGFEPSQQQEYLRKTLERFSAIPDLVTRVGRSVLRKLSRHERFIRPAAQLSEDGTYPTALLQAVAALLRFYDEADAEAVQLRSRLLKVQEIPALVTELTGITPADSLYSALLEVTQTAAAELQ